MKKNILNLLIISIICLLFCFIPTIVKAHNISIPQVKNVKVSEITSSSIKIKWSKIKNITGYRVYIYDKNEQVYKFYKTVETTSLRINNLKSSKNYRFKVRAYLLKNGKKYYGKKSIELITSTNPDKVKELKTDKRTDSSLTISWKNQSRVTGYRVYIYNNSSKKYEYYDKTKNNSIIIKNLSSMTEYKIKIRAYKEANNAKYYGQKSDAIKEHTRLSKVSSLSIKENNSKAIILKWNKVNNAEGYRIYKYNNETRKWHTVQETKKSSVTITKEENELVYIYKVRAFININNEKEYGKYSDIFSVQEGIDVSGYQKEIDWQKVKDAGIKLAIIRCGGRFYGKNAGQIYNDSYFETNITQASSLGIDIGIYFFSAAITEEEAKEEAYWCINELKKYNMQDKCKYIAFDFEVYKQGRAEKLKLDQLNKNAIAFLSKVSKNGYIPLLYGNPNYFKNYYDVNSILKKVPECKIWLAHYTKSGEITTYEGNYDIWQYTSTGTIDGIEGDVDLNLIYL